MQAAAKTLVTEHEFLKLPESMEKVELIDGEVYTAPAPTARHQSILARLCSRLLDWADAHPQPFTVLPAPLDVKFAPSRILQPDISVFDQALDLSQKGPITVVPVLCVEILSRDRIHDRVTKRMLYGAAGVTEYWIIHQSGNAERFYGEGLDGHAFIDVLQSDVVPGFSLAVSALVPDLG